MRDRTSAPLLLLSTTAFGAFGCSPVDSPFDADMVVAPNRTPTVTPVIGPVDQGPVSPDEVFARLAQLAPGFAGFYFEDGVLVVNSTQGADAEKVRAVVQSRVGAKRVRSAPTRARDVSYSWQQLHGWMYAWTFAFGGVDSLISYDIDEVRNQIVVKVAAPSDVAILREGWATLGFPDAALHVERAEYPRPLTAPAVSTTVADYSRPIRGGIRIQIENPSGIGASPCTLTASATHGNFPGDTLFLTNSHCTSEGIALDGIGRVDGVIAAQNDLSQASQQIGYEVVDPPFTTASDLIFGACPASIGCRHADVAMFKYYTGGAHDNDRAFGEIALTTGYGSTTLSSSHFPIGWAIEGLWSAPIYIGDGIDRVGSTTGWSRATVTETCAHDLFPGGAREFWCQYRASTQEGEDSEGGDSGAPVFGNEIHSLYPDALYGVLWGEDLKFSPAFGIERDLGQSLVVDKW